MKDIKHLVREHIKDNRFSMIFGILIYSIVNVLISMIFQKLNLLLLGFIPTTIISFIFLIQLFGYSDQVVNGKVVTYKDLFKPFKVTKKHIIIALTYVAWALVSVVILMLIAKNAILAPLAIIILVGLFVISNAINNTFYFINPRDIEVSYMTSVKAVFKDKKLLLSNGLKTVGIIMKGAILIVIVNVFAFGPQLNVLLDRTDLQATELIQKIFANDVSAFIQSVGVQAIMYYILFVSCITFGTYVRKNRTKIKH